LRLDQLPLTIGELSARHNPCSYRIRTGKIDHDITQAIVRANPIPQRATAAWSPWFGDPCPQAAPGRVF
jgi:hypothetical protein